MKLKKVKIFSKTSGNNWETPILEKLNEVDFDKNPFWFSRYTYSYYDADFMVADDCLLVAKDGVFVRYIEVRGKDISFVSGLDIGNVHIGEIEDYDIVGDIGSRFDGGQADLKQRTEDIFTVLCLVSKITLEEYKNAEFMDAIEEGGFHGLLHLIANTSNQKFHVSVNYRKDTILLKSLYGMTKYIHKDETPCDELLTI